MSRPKYPQNTSIGALIRDPDAIRITPINTNLDGDYVIFIDESGDPDLERIDPRFPVLNLLCVLIRKEDYLDQVIPHITAIKQQFFGDSDLVLHESEMRRKQGPFKVFSDTALHHRCVSALLGMMREAPIHVIAASIHKARLKSRYSRPFDPYDLAMRFCLERIHGFLKRHGQTERLTQVVFESRGKREDRRALAQFVAIHTDSQPVGQYRPDYARLPMEPLFIAKKANLAGHQLCDLLARPFALESMQPGSQTRVMQAIRPHLLAHKIFPNPTYGAGNTRVRPSANSRQAISYPDHAVRRTIPSASAHTST